MSNPILIIGESGTGKSTSLRNLHPNETFIIQAVGKPLPFRGWRKSYTLFDKTENPQGNLVITDDPLKIVGFLKAISQNKPEIKNVIIDDSNYIMSNQFMRKANEKGFEKYNSIGSSFFSLIEGIGFYREDLNIVLFGHSEQKEDGKTGMKTAGKLLDNQYSIAGLFTIVFETFITDKSEYKFITQNNGRNCSKSPMGMFESHYIENDLKQVFEAIKQYEEGE